MGLGFLLNGLLTWAYYRVFQTLGHIVVDLRRLTGVYPARPKRVACAVRVVPYVEAKVPSPSLVPLVSLVSLVPLVPLVPLVGVLPPVHLVS